MNEKKLRQQVKQFQIFDICGKIIKITEKSKAWENKYLAQWIQRADLDEKRFHCCTKWTHKLQAEKRVFLVGSDGVFLREQEKGIGIGHYTCILLSGNRWL